MAARLPPVLIIDPAHKTPYRFAKIAKDGSISKLLGCHNVTMLIAAPGTPKCEIYCDDDGMYKQEYGMNVFANPWIDESMLCNMAAYGGPLGPIAVYRKGGHTRKQLIALFKAYDARVKEDDGEEGEKETEETKKPTKNKRKRKEEEEEEEEEGEWTRALAKSLKAHDSA
jgi:hypothetical protein